MASLEQQIAELPTTPGCYLFKDRDGRVIYVGKAKNLRARVRNYLGGDDRVNVPFLVNDAATVEPLITSTEKEALLLENTLIKQHQPRYNIELKDDKHYLCVRVDPKQKYPRVQITRRIRDDGARYFGPYHSATSIRETVRLINRHFQLRTCKDTVFKNRRRPCLQYEIKRCPAPCVLQIDDAAYKQSVSDAIAFLEGKESDLVTGLSARMRHAAAMEEFERAAQLRDQISAIEESLEKQRVMSADLEDRDVFAIARDGPRAVIQLLWVRDGLLKGGRTFDIDSSELPTAELLEDALRQYYDQTTSLPREVLLPMPVEGAQALEEWLRERKSGRSNAVSVYVPERGPKKKLVDIAQANAEHRLKTRVETDEAATAMLERLQQALRLQSYPERIECYDISNTQGGQVVGSQVVFEDGFPARGEYRLFKIKAVVGQDDFKSLREVLTRRLKRGLEDGELPNLIVIDGGVGQLNVARAVFADLGIEGVDLCSLAKSRLLDDETGFHGDDSADRQTLAESLGGTEEADMQHSPELEYSPERVFLPGQKNPIVLKPHSAELRVLTYLRDEAHRFAITFHRKLRQKRGLRSQLDDVPQLGPARKKALLRHFGSVAAFIAAEDAALDGVPGVPAGVARAAQAHLKNKPADKLPSPPTTTAGWAALGVTEETIDGRGDAQGDERGDERGDGLDTRQGDEKSDDDGQP